MRCEAKYIRELAERLNPRPPAMPAAPAVREPLWGPLVNVRALWLAVLLQALIDAKWQKHSYDRGCIHCEARRWLMRRGVLNEVGDAETVYELLGLELSGRVNLERWLDDPDVELSIACHYDNVWPLPRPIGYPPPTEFELELGTVQPRIEDVACRFCGEKFGLRNPRRGPRLRDHVRSAHRLEWLGIKAMIQTLPLRRDHIEREAPSRRVGLTNYRPGRPPRPYRYVHDGKPY